MQQLRLIIAFFFVIAFTWSCKKETDATTPPPPGTSKGERVKREHGQLTGTAVKFTIGAGGGTLSSADGRITLTIPAGAVDAATEFSIQPITNALETRGLAYRLLPEGINFKKDILIKYSYAGINLATTESKYLFLTYQDAQGYYHEATRTQNDKVAQLLSVQTKHFSDWTFVSRMELKTDHQLINGAVYLKKSQDLRLQVHNFFPVKNSADPYDVDADLHVDMTLDLMNEFKWTQSKAKGKITPRPAPSIADYKAPDAITQKEELMLTVTVSGNDIGTDNLAQPVKQMILSQPVILEPEDEEYFFLSTDGNERSLQLLTAEYIPGWINIGGYTSANGPLAIFLFASGTGSFSFGEVGQANKAHIEFTPQSTETYVSFRPQTCDGGGLTFSSGSVRLTKIAQAVGEYTEGDFTAGLYRTAYCANPGSKNISGRFKIRKRF
ncbi:MAG TPA: hypothetical protein VM884_11030 [Flavisolibacter sp.]|nr:hypothetical protein [Flavisolibacter sp.]